jgi:hypothetical protein
LSKGRTHYEKKDHEMSVLKKIKYHLLEAIRFIWPYLICHESGVLEVKLHINYVMDPLETCISNLSGGRNHYEKPNHEMLVLKKFKYHVVEAIVLIWPIQLFMKVVFKSKVYIN